MNLKIDCISDLLNTERKSEINPRYLVTTFDLKYTFLDYKGFQLFIEKNIE